MQTTGIEYADDNGQRTAFII